MRSRAGLSLELLFFALGGFCFWGIWRVSPAEQRGFEHQPVAEAVLRVVTWNLGTGVDAGTQGLRNRDLEHVARVLEGLDAELVFLQELTGNHQLKSLGRALGPEWSFELTRIRSGRPLGVLVRRGKFEALELSFLERAQAVAYVSAGGMQVTCVNLHADAFSASGRNQSIGRASDFLQRLGADQATLLVGDLNLDLDIDKRRDLFTDDEYQDVETYNFLASHMWDTGLGAGATAKPDRRIDYIFVGKSDFQVLQSGPYLGQLAEGMDHHPMVADLRALK